MKMKLAEIARVVGATCATGDADSPTVTGVCFDTRQLQPGDLFIPLNGERDGHSFIPQAAAAGAAATFVAADHARSRRACRCWSCRIH